MATEKQIEANRRNAQRSTGPRTEEGKAKSRRNALKHGLSGEGIVLRRRDEKKLAKTVNEWREILAPVNALEEKLVERGALATIRLDRAVKQSEAERRDRVHRALKRLEGRLQSEIGRTAKELPNDPGAAIRKLKSSARGVSWLLEEWRKLRDVLEADGCWSHENAAVALRLLGKRPCAAYPDDASVAALRRAFLGALPEVDPEEAATVLGLENPADDSPERLAFINAQLPGPAAAREALRAIAAEEVNALEALQAALADDPRERAERSHVIDRAQIDTSVPSYRLHRYELDHELSMHRNLNELIRIRRQEPELASIARWEKTGKKYNRRWDGYSWVPNAEWRLEDGVVGAAWGVGREDQEPKAAEASLASGGSLRSTPGTRTDGPVEGREEAGLAGDGPVMVSGPSLRSDPGTQSDGVLSGEEAPRRVPGAESKTMPRLPASEADEVRAGICSDEQPLLWVPGVERSDPPDAVVRSEQAPSRGPDQEPARDRLSSASGGSLCSTPGSRPEAPENEPDFPPQIPEPASGWIDRQTAEHSGIGNHEGHKGRGEDKNGIWPGRSAGESGDCPGHGQPDREFHNGLPPAEHTERCNRK